MAFAAPPNTSWNSNNRFLVMTSCTKAAVFNPSLIRLLYIHIALHQGDIESAWKCTYKQIENKEVGKVLPRTEVRL